MQNPRVSARKLIGALLFFLWAALIVAALYGVQKPIAFSIVQGTLVTGWTLVLAGLFLVNSAGIGGWVLSRIRPTGLTSVERLLIGTGMGIGAYGVVGLALVAADVTQPTLFLFLQIAAAALLWWRGAIQTAWNDMCQVAGTLWNQRTTLHPLAPIALVLTLVFSFLLTLTPPDAFDALLYHLTWPAWVLRDGGLRPYDVPPFWFPGLVESTFLWALSAGSDRAPQLFHLAWTLLAALIVWHWARRVWGESIGWTSLLVLISMPSLPILASWAYTDFALTYYALATLFAVWRWRDTRDWRWIIVAGIGAGFAMGVKYTSFTVSLTASLLILWWSRHSWREALANLVRFGLVALVVMLPWYLRNWFLMGNPVYPFVFDGRYWDSFRAAWYAEAGSGIGWNLRELILLPLNATLGYRDETFFDGRIGPLFLVLLPVTLAVAWQELRGGSRLRRDAAVAIGLFVGVGSLFWTLGVISSRALWQSRLLFPVLFPFALLTALAWRNVYKLDTRVLRVSFLINVVFAGVIALALVESGLFVVGHNPLAVATGVESREQYFHRVQPGYAGAVDLVEETPEDAQVYFFFEPRSYGMTRRVQPDSLLDNLAHGLYVQDDPSLLLKALRAQGYTHVLLYRRGAAYLVEHRAERMPARQITALVQLTQLLDHIQTTDDGRYELYKIPAEGP